MFQNKKITINTKISLIAIQFSVLIFIAFSKFIKFNITSFSNRIMGNGPLNGVDIDKRIKYYYLLFIAVVLVGIIIYKLLEKFLKNADSKTLKFMNIVALLGILNTIFDLINKLNGNSSILLFSTFALCTINFILIIVNNIKEIKCNLGNVKWALLASTPLTFLCMIIANKVLPNMGDISKLIMWVVAFFVISLLLYIIINSKRINKNALKKSYIAFMLAPILEYIYIELYSILNQHNVFLPNKFYTIVFIYIASLVLSITIYMFIKNKKISGKFKKYYYPIVLITFALIIAALPLKTKVETEFFESANHGMRNL